MTSLPYPFASGCGEKLTMYFAWPYVVPRVRLKPLMPMATDFYAWGHETNQNSGMPGTETVNSSGVLGPRMASGAISGHQICVGACP